MQPDLPSLTRACQAEETALRTIFADIAAAFVPPLRHENRRPNHHPAAPMPSRIATPCNARTAFICTAPHCAPCRCTPPSGSFLTPFCAICGCTPPPSPACKPHSRHRLPLFPPPPPPYGPAAQTLALHSRTWDRMHAHLSPHTPNLYHDTPGHHGDLPYPSTDFLRYAMAARRICLAMDKHRRRFSGCRLRHRSESVSSRRVVHASRRSGI